MRIDHIAFRVADRLKTANFFIKAFNYKLAEEFEIQLEKNDYAKCVVLTPPEKSLEKIPFIQNFTIDNTLCEYHEAPEIFISDGKDCPNGIIDQWVQKRSNIGGIHHIAYQVNNIEKTIKELKEKGFAEFTTDEYLSCDNLKQIFTKPSELTGIIFEFIERKEKGFCKDNVKSLMLSTKNI